MCLGAGDWRSPDVAVAHTPWLRLAGLRAVPSGWGLLLPGGAVHGHGLTAPIRLVALDAGWRVREVRWLEPRRFALLRGAAWTLELPAATPAPEPGARLEPAAADGSDDSRVQ